VEVSVAAGKVPYATLAFAGLSLAIPFASYGLTGDLIGGDAAIAWALPAQQLHQVAGVYVDTPGLGYNGATGLASAFPALTIAAGLHAAGVPTAIVARLIIALYFFLAMTGAWRLFTAVLPDDRASRIAAFIGALFYAVNRYTVLLYFTAQTYFPMVYVALPWLLYGVIEGCERRRGRGIAIVVAALVWAGGAGANPALFGVALCVLGVAAALELAQGVPLRRVAVVTGVGAALGLACCAWWILPLATSVGAGLDTVSAASVGDWALWMSDRSSFLNLFKLDGYTGTSEFPFADWYGSAVGSAFGYIPLAIGLAGLGTYRRRFSAVALLAFAVAVFLSKGVHEPFGWVYQALLDHVPVFSIFRSPYVKWIALEAVLLSLIFALGAAGIVGWIGARSGARSRTVRFALAAVAVAVMAYPWPAYAGRMLSPDYHEVGFRSIVPAAYADVAAILQRAGSGVRTIVLNPGSAPYPFYTWGYFGEDPLDVAAQTPIADFTTLLPDAPRMPAGALAAALRSLSVRFVAVHHDVRNAVPSPDPNVLVAAGAAVLVYRSKELDLYRIAGAVEPVAQVLDAPVMAQRRDTAVSDGRIGETAPGVLDPNVGFRVPGAPLQVVAPVASAGAPADVDAAGAAFGWIRDETDAPGSPAGELAFVPADPLAVTYRQQPCGDRDGMRLAAPSRWRLGSHEVGTPPVQLCFGGRSVGTPTFGGLTPDPHGAAQFSFPNGSPLAVDVPELGPPAARARRALQPGLPFLFRTPATTRVLFTVLPHGARATGVWAVVRTPTGADLGAAVSSPFGSLTIPLVTPLRAGAAALLYLHAATPAAFVGLQSLRVLPIGIDRPASERLRVPIDQRLLAPVSLDARAATTARVVSTEAVPPIGATPAPIPPVLHWVHGVIGEAGAWSVAPGRIEIASGTSPSEVHALGILRATDRYDLTLRYRATGYAEVWTRIDGDDNDHIWHLRADGQWHRFACALFPVPGSSGTYVVRLRGSVGRLDVTNARLVAGGPNGIVLAWQRPARGAGRVLGVTRPFPWRFDVRVDGCAPCILRLGVSDARQWMVRGAAVRGRFRSQGDASGPWATITTGAATWLLDAGGGTRDVTFVYIPALLAGAGLCIALLAAVVTLVVALRAGAALPHREPARAAVRYAPFRATLVALAVVTPIAGALVPMLGDLGADALWIGLVVFAGALLRGDSPAAAPRP